MTTPTLRARARAAFDQYQVRQEQIARDQNARMRREMLRGLAASLHMMDICPLEQVKANAAITTINQLQVACLTLDTIRLVHLGRESFIGDLHAYLVGPCPAEGCPGESLYRFHSLPDLGSLLARLEQGRIPEGRSLPCLTCQDAKE